ncbi:MAG: response regulator transcription factor [Epsilonproteobacteria bacterium]|nr:response regulator transcription factor [Campylobacterota bacterium]
MGKMDRFSVLIADDHEIVRSGIKFTIESEEQFYIEDEASSYDELQLLLAAKQYALLILDLNLGDKNGIQTIKDISKQYENLPILVLSMFPEDPYALQSIQAGAKGYLNKKIVSKDLRYAIHKSWMEKST